MKRIMTGALVCLAVGMLMARAGYASEGIAAGAAETGDHAAGQAKDGSPRITLTVPLMESRFAELPVASINDEQITLEHLTEVVASSHAGRAETLNADKVRVNFTDPLNRLIDVRLIVQEARNVGLDELPEVKRELDVFSRTLLRQQLIKEITNDVAADPREIEAVYADLVREWKLKSLLFTHEGDAGKAARRIRNGEDFGAVAAWAINEKKAQGSDQAEFMKAAALSPEIRAVVSKMRIGEVSPVVKVAGEKQPGYTLVKLEDVRYPEDPVERERAKTQALATKKKQVLQAFQAALAKKYLTVNRKLLEGLDYEAKKPGMEKLLKDQRVLATISGEEPILVKDLSQAINEAFFHGMEKPLKEKRINTLKRDKLSIIWVKRLLHKEALLRGGDNTRFYREQMRKKEETLLFGMFIQKVIAPKVTFGDVDLKAYYQDHAAEYTYPAMIKLDGLAFNTVRDAEQALEKLKRDADFSWIRKNAEGLADMHDEDALAFEANAVLVSSMPEAIRQALVGARAGDYRLASMANGLSYVLWVQEEIPARQQPIEEVVQTIAQNVFNGKLNDAIHEWTGKLRNTADIAVYLAAPAGK